MWRWVWIWSHASTLRRLLDTSFIYVEYICLSSICVFLFFFRSSEFVHILIEVTQVVYISLKAFRLLLMRLFSAKCLKVRIFLIIVKKSISYSLHRMNLPHLSNNNMFYEWNWYNLYARYIMWTLDVHNDYLGCQVSESPESLVISAINSFCSRRNITFLASTWPNLRQHLYTLKISWILLSQLLQKRWLQDCNL